MECPNCHFHNMPGNSRCLKCGGRLDVAAAAIVIEPPRASARAKRIRKWLPGWMRVFRSVDSPDQHPQAAAAGRVPLGALWRMIVPGWGQWYLGNAARARNYFVPWLPLLLWGLVGWGSLLAGVALYAALAVHAVSIMDLLLRPPRRSK